MASVNRPIYSLDDIPDVSVAAPAAGEVLKWNGTAWVSAAYNVSYAFGASLDDGEAATQLCGEVGTMWRAIGAIAFTAAYTNGPATSAHIVSDGWIDVTLDDPFTSVVSTSEMGYPAAGASVTFTLHAAKGAETSTPSTSVAFHNLVYYGVSAKADTYLESDIEGLTPTAPTPTKGRTITFNAGAGEYIIYALPARLGTVTFTVGGFTGGFLSPSTVSVTNSAGYVENYYVYRSTNPSLGSVTVVIV